MAQRKIWLIKKRQNSRQRSHFAIFVPDPKHADCDPHDRASGHAIGTLIHVTGSPFSGYVHEFKLNFDNASDEGFGSALQIGSIDEQYIQDPPHREFKRSPDPLGYVPQIDAVALQVPPPRKSENPSAPVNDASTQLLALSIG